MARPLPFPLLPQNPRIAFIRFSSMGDVVKASALPRHVKQCFPQGKVAFVTLKEHAPFFQDNPHVETMFTYHRPTGIGGLKPLARQLCQWKPHLVVDLHRSLRSRLLRKMCGSLPVVQYQKHHFRRFLQIHFGWQGAWAGVHKERDFLDPLTPYGIQNDGKGLELHPQGLVNQKDFRQKFAAQLQTLRIWKQEGALVLGLAPVAAWPLKCWPLPYFKQLAQQYLAHTVPKGRIVVFGGGGEHGASELADSLGGDALNLVGCTQLLESAYFCTHTRFMVANDTGMMHIAEAVGCPVLALFGPTGKTLGYFPSHPKSLVLERFLPCRPCTPTGQGRCTHAWPQACLQSISPGDAWRTLQGMLTHV